LTVKIGDVVPDPLDATRDVTVVDMEVVPGGVLITSERTDGTRCRTGLPGYAWVAYKRRQADEQRI
jgi:hypothetical protein